MDTTKAPGIQIAQVFLERAEFSHREDFLALAPNTPADVSDMLLTMRCGTSNDHKRGIVRIRAQTKPEQRPLYNIDVEMTALVEVEEGKENMPLEQYVRTSGPAMVYTFVRQMVADLTWRGRFGPVWLNPVNLIALTEQPSREGEREAVLYGPSATTGKVRSRIGPPKKK